VIYIIVVIALAIVGIAILAAAVKIVRPFQRWASTRPRRIRVCS
jgi:regulator of protease activity HflC (stomatin/prohibitin superfamily)